MVTAKKVTSKNKVTRKQTAKKKIAKKKGVGLLHVSDIGISNDYVVGSAHDEFGYSPSRSSLFEDDIDILSTHTAGEISVFHRPLASSRSSFWLGVGFGILIIGVLAVLSWEFIRVDLFKASVLGL